VEQVQSEAVLSNRRDADHPYRIGDLAREYDVTLRTLRFYEDKGLLNPKRSGTTRLYSELDRSHLKLILLGKKVGFPLVKITELLNQYDFDAQSYTDPQAVKQLFASQLDEMVQQQAVVADAIDELEKQLSEL
jgi:DNA-binding transcriptional MerR regulator